MAERIKLLESDAQKINVLIQGKLLQIHLRWQMSADSWFFGVFDAEKNTALIENNRLTSDVILAFKPGNILTGGFFAYSAKEKYAILNRESFQKTHDLLYLETDELEIFEETHHVYKII